MTPSFDGRAICYPTTEILLDYLAWRQVDTHVNNQVWLCCVTAVTLFICDCMALQPCVVQCPICSMLAKALCHLCGLTGSLMRIVYVQYNTCYWALVHDGCTGAEAQQILKVSTVQIATLMHPPTDTVQLADSGGILSSLCFLTGDADRLQKSAAV